MKTQSNKSPLQPGCSTCWTNCPFISLFSSICPITFFFFSLLPPASFYLCVIYDVCCFINRFCWLFFSSSLPLRSSPLKRLFHRKCKLPAAAVDSRTSEAKLWVWMLEESIKFQTLPAALVLLPDRSERRWFSHKHYLSCCEKAAKFKMMVGNKRHRIPLSRLVALVVVGGKKRSGKNIFAPPLLSTESLGCRCCISVQVLHNGNHKRNGILLCAIDLFL